MIDPREMLATLGDHFATVAKVQNVFGEPVEAHGKTIIPVARVSYRLGAGAGEGGETPSDPSAAKKGGGGGGGGGVVQAVPVGVLEVTEAGARFVRFFDPQMATGLIAGGAMLGLLLRRWLRRK